MRKGVWVPVKNFPKYEAGSEGDIRNKEAGKTYSSMNACERDLGIDHSEISKYLSGKITYPPKGYAFDLVE